MCRLRWNPQTQVDYVALEALISEFFWVCWSSSSSVCRPWGRSLWIFVTFALQTWRKRDGVCFPGTKALCSCRDCCWLLSENIRYGGLLSPHLPNEAVTGGDRAGGGGGCSWLIHFINGIPWRQKGQIYSLDPSCSGSELTRWFSGGAGPPLHQKCLIFSVRSRMFSDLFKWKTYVIL